VGGVVCAPDAGWRYHPKHVEQFFPDKINCVTLHHVGYILEYETKSVLKFVQDYVRTDLLRVVSGSIYFLDYSPTCWPTQLKKEQTALSYVITFAE
jgi:hypothetical protein